MMATCGTFLVLPLRNINNMVKASDYDELKKNHKLPHDPIVVDDLAGYLDAMKTEFIMFFLGFLIICTIWETNIIRTNVIKRYDDFMVILGLFQMAAIVVLPFSIALNGAYPREDVTVLLTITILIIINIFELIMILYGFYCPRLLNMAMKDWSNKEVRRFMLRMCIKPVMEILLVGVAGAFTLLNYQIAWAMLALLVISPLMRKLGYYYERHHVGYEKREKCRFFYFYTKGQISKERVEAMSDAAIAIIACVLILDITVEDFPTKHAVHEEGLINVLREMKFDFGAFFGAYCGVSILWYINHTVLNLFHTIDIGTLYLQKIFLAFLCFLPIVNNMMVRYGFGQEGTQADRRLAIQWSGGISFAAGITQTMMVVWGYFRKEKLLHRWATCNKSEMNRKQLLYVRSKICAVPIWALLCIFSSLAPGSTSVYLLLACAVGNLLTMLILKFMFMNHINEPGISIFDHSNHGSILSNGSGCEMRKQMKQEIADGFYDSRDHSAGECDLRKGMAEEIADGKVYQDENEMEREVLEEAEKKEIKDEQKEERQENDMAQNHLQGDKQDTIC
uniref:Endosomal/lysosomal proton channel TMEM175 n=2 Tax=Clytia hemisphaerica TaxID=252671 RepID=A0A7M5V6C2_9CNID